MEFSIVILNQLIYHDIYIHYPITKEVLNANTYFKLLQVYRSGINSKIRIKKRMIKSISVSIEYLVGLKGQAGYEFGSATMPEATSRC